MVEKTADFVSYISTNILTRLSPKQAQGICITNTLPFVVAFAVYNASANEHGEWNKYS